MTEQQYYKALKDRQPDLYQWVVYMKAVFKEVRPVEVWKNER